MRDKGIEAYKGKRGLPKEVGEAMEMLYNMSKIPTQEYIDSLKRKEETKDLTKCLSKI